jgi:hypothetical protein
MDPMKVTNNVASRNSHNILPKSVAARKTNGNAPMVTVSPRLAVVMVKPNVLMDLTKVTKPVASKDTDSTTTRDVAATQAPNGLVPTVNASPNPITVTVNFNARMALMSNSKNAASRASRNTVSENVAATQTPNGPVKLVLNVLKRPLTVMVKPNAETNLMKKTAASEVSYSTTKRNVAATLRPNSLVITVSASQTAKTVTVEPNVLMDLMKEKTCVASKASRLTLPRSADVVKMSTRALMVNVSPMLSVVTVEMSVVMV